MLFRSILNNRNIRKWGGTDYCPVLEANVETFGFHRPENVETKRFFGLFKSTSTQMKYHSTSQTGYPVIVFFFTDGENSDTTETEQYLEFCQNNNLNIYFQFIGIGDGDFNFLNRIADKFQNTGFIHMNEFDKIVDNDDFINKLLSDELCEYLKNQ